MTDSSTETGDPEQSRTQRVREAELCDAAFLEELETEAFPVHRRSSRRSIRNSIASASQLVLIAEELGDGGRRRAAAATVFIYKRSLRIYSIAVLDEFRLRGFGRLLMNEIIARAQAGGCEKISLEADASNAALISWYQKFGFEQSHLLPNYYRLGEAACRMLLRLGGDEGLGERFVVVMDEENGLELDLPGLAFATAGEYITDKRYSSSTRFHVLNFCKSYKTHSLGYYVSLLAAARNHRITPSVMSVKDASNRSIAQSIFDEIADLVAERLAKWPGRDFAFTVILGRTPNAQFAGLARKLFTLFELPFFSVELERREHWEIRKISILSYRSVCCDHAALLRDALRAYCERKRHFRTRLKNYKYDLAILVDPDEKTPPSCPGALKKFRAAAEKTGFSVEFIGRQDQRRLCEFDALFIRETTAIENHSYAMARQAYTDGLVVIDDPWSILLCSNKVYLHERLANAGVAQPKGFVLTKKMCSPQYLATLPLPLVLKLPEGSFSRAVFLAHSVDELRGHLAKMFADSALVIAQEFMQSDYDWRLGVMDNMPLFACKYYMASGHWQIYNWQAAEGEELSGRSETLPIAEVPACIVKAALKATALIGNGLYGVDLKEVGGKAYVIEVNDNPNIDVGVEDLLLGDELYLRIMQSIFNRIEIERLQSRTLI
jgi:glutathione synthase/RimK-type ligase-like ATP-grasp enzyme/ribosomal protein S18 acetylase RimI-like enzyme